MEGTAAQSFTQDDKQLLVKVVKLAQQRKIRGSCGEWLDNLRLENGPLTKSDPALWSWESLAKFVHTFSSEEDVQLVKRVRKWYKWSSATSLAEEDDPWPETPEQKLVKLTRQNPLYSSAFSFLSYEKGWTWTKRGHSSSPQRLLSLDCEMAMCEGYESQVVQVCVVDQKFETVLNTLVKPSKKVIDLITHIHGITSAQLKQATCTQEEIQKKVKKLLKPGTILVGHSVNNDLKALKIDHRRVIDTSMMMRPKGVSWTTPISLDALCKSFLGYNIRDYGKHHDCLEDAIVPMKLVLHELQNGPSLLEKGDDGDSNRLLIHKIPQRLTAELLRKLITDAIPCSIEKIKGTKARAYAVFPTKELAEQAFSKLPGEAGEDSSGYEQKTVSRWNGAQFVQFRVRKMSRDDRSAGEEDQKSPKRLKIASGQEQSRGLIGS